MKILESYLSLKRLQNKSDNKEVRQKLEMLILHTKNNHYSKRHLKQVIEIDYSKRVLAEKVGVSGTTILAWKEKYQKGGLSYLLAKKIQDLKISQKVEERTLQYMLRNPTHLSFTKIYERVKEEFPEVQYSNLIKHIKNNHKPTYAIFEKEKKEKPRKRYYVKKIKPD